MIHQVVTRGDVFAAGLFSGELTVIPADAEVMHMEIDVRLIMNTLGKALSPEAREELSKVRKNFQRKAKED
jgi:hypothetical protein